MIELSVNGLTKFYGANRLFETISFEIKTGERIALIGQNGCGKTTIMKILMGKEDYQGGEVSLRKGNRMGYLDQIPVFDQDATTIDVVRMAFDQVYAVKAQMEELEHRMVQAAEEELDRLMVSYARLQEQFELQHGYELETKLEKIMEGLQITPQMREILFNHLSGGEKTRVLLAKILLEEPDILLLDEPTNHLDLAAIEWLESFLKDYKGAVLIVSHDRYFLDSVVDRIIELFSDHMETYQGNYSYYVVEKERRFLIELRNYENQKKKIERMENQIERYRIWGTMRDSEKMFKRAKELEKRLEKLETLKRPVFEQRRIRLNQLSAGRSGKLVLELADLSKVFDGRTILSDVTLQLFYQDSACIIGDNGSGKSTLLKLILGEINPECGTIKLGAQVSIGYLPQQVEYPDEEQTILEYFARLHNLSNGAARAQLAKVLFCNDEVNKKIKNLSGGEKSRLRLCSLTFVGVNFLILDEPTNHLDVASREVLEEMLSDFEGTLLMVSHDRYFIAKLADKIIRIEDGEAKIYQGDYEYYQAERKKELERQQDITRNQIASGKEGSDKDESKKGLKTSDVEPKNTSDKKETENGRPASLSKKNEHRLLLAEQLIEELEESLSHLKEQMEIFSTDNIRLNELFSQRSELEKELEQAYTNWGELQN